MAGDSYGGGIALVQNGERPRFFSRRSRRNSISGSSGHGSEDEEMRMDALSGLQMPPTTFDEVRSIASSSENPRAAFQRSRSLEYMSSTEPLRQTPPCTLSACGKEVESMAQEAFGRQTLPNEKIDPLQAMSRRSLHGSSRTDQSRCPDNRLSQSTHCVGRNQPTPSRINRIRNPYLGTNPDGRRRVRLGGRSQETTTQIPPNQPQNSFQTTGRVLHTDRTTSTQASSRPNYTRSQSQYENRSGLSTRTCDPRDSLSQSQHTPTYFPGDRRPPSSLTRGRRIPQEATSIPTSRRSLPRTQSVTMLSGSATPTARTERRNPEASPRFSFSRSSSQPCLQSSANQDTEVNPLLIEISPGVAARVCGAKETYQAVENDFYRPATCQICQSDVCCILDASYLLCPKCRSVSPLEGGNTDGDLTIGMGFTMDQLQTWQSEILATRSAGQHASQSRSNLY